MPRPLPQRLRILRVGGSVRDELLGRPVSDRDYVVVGATPEIMLASGFRPVGRDFPVFLHPETQEEHALARTERKHGQGYRGFEFFASPDVTLEEDLARRDLTINAMARAEDGALIDPFGGERDLRDGILRHVSPAFAEDPLRVLRVARFAARLGFVVAPETQVLLGRIVDGNELATLSPERVWRELAQGLSEAQPARMLAVLRDCGALAELLPEVDALFGITDAPGTSRNLQTGANPAIVPAGDAGLAVGQALDWAAARSLSLPVRYAILVQGLGVGARTGRQSATDVGVAAIVRRDVVLAQRVSARLRVPQDAGDAARLGARWRRAAERAPELAPAAILAILAATDALRRPERLEWLLGASAAAICSQTGTSEERFAGNSLRLALAAIRNVDAGGIARKTASRKEDGNAPAEATAIAQAVRRARLAALRKMKLGMDAADAKPAAAVPSKRRRGDSPR